MNIADYLLERGEDERPVLITLRNQATYRELRAAAARLSGELLSLGITNGDRVGLLSENSLFWVAAYLAILKIGAVAVPFPTVATPEDLARKEGFIGCKTMCVERRMQRKFSTAFAAGACLLFDEVLQETGPSVWPEPQADFDLRREAALMLTSGTTTRPWVVRITHRNIQANTDSIIQYLELDQAERMLAILPFYYCFGTSLLHTHLRVGASLVLCNTFAYPETALDLLASADCTGLAGVPSTYQTLLRNSSFPQRAFPCLRKVQQAGGKLPTVFIQELAAVLPQARVYVMYGQTEATARLSYLPPELLATKLGSIGRGIPGVRLIVQDEAGQVAAPGEIGEIVAYGENISPGYLDDPEASAAKFVDDGLRTGDLATVDEDGFIYIVDRKDDFIKVLGHRVSSQEVEACILELPEVVAAAAIGMPDLVQGEAIQAFVVLKGGARLGGEEILAHCRGRLARHMWPKEIVFIDRLPTNPHGKFVKSLLRQPAHELVT